MTTNELVAPAFSIDEIVGAIRDVLEKKDPARGSKCAPATALTNDLQEALPLEYRRALSEAQAASYLNVSVSNLRKLRMNRGREGHMPPVPYVQLGRRISYLRDDLDKILVANRVEVSE